jgi:hypothetical protein
MKAGLLGSPPLPAPRALRACAVPQLPRELHTLAFPRFLKRIGWQKAGRLCLLFIVALLPAPCLAADFHGTGHYDVGYGFFKLAESDMSLDLHADGSYESTVDARATGLAKFLSGSRTDHFKSTGRIVDGRLRPDKFVKQRASHGESKTEAFVFDHEAKTIQEEKTECEKGHCKTQQQTLSGPDYATDDILSLYWNAAAAFSSGKAKSFTSNAVGGKGGVGIVLPEGEQAKTAQKEFGPGGIHLLMLLKQDILATESGELYIDVGPGLIANQVVLKKTLLFGDMWGDCKQRKIDGDPWPILGATPLPAALPQHAAQGPGKAAQARPAPGDAAPPQGQGNGPSQAPGPASKP